MTPAARRRLRWAGLALILLLAVVQWIPAERSNPPLRSEVDAPADVRAILVRACYDCHSHETRWPWYSRVAPASWWIASHVRHARDDLNFSDWPSPDSERRGEVLREIEEQVSSGEMPLRSYAWLHSGARLTEADRQSLVRWARSDR